ncbi:fatty acid oxidation complex subunit alpha FadB [Acinetobacter gerneri]|jgi:3-hydroxyacyl-CoA dehydrogenase/enoyl-CoA hydratase/3-hydroxybutyryl-CoA epimerase/enoyl-CoA isomerase|uniref:enoyl-CoA hydratase n=2 Tax=Acinetobacter gerneri TaxID=202952 RepID=N8Y6D7_9GAMM|nr:fatty acid oxidation complex subunit alpha FadB [Acinetobacter gerneri]ENV32327.1 fatty acid oxidation complex subunit alpha [Acinetobacter gerneri DSM 14967 = CIP 107464 = MTCC 9824]EPR85122.1 Enoyl-CoA hydratase [Acinetobacter gerneri DSM 14967 = CIP 107464 = MTCC 9824]MCH4245023.1 fatty acid oxidation complex subunit alpha FadB [Acinetobacter gerneri]MDQ9011410.1 fatty acid oxidation complex subunit alpha FadB [Acinetobacter gerneri]MDQ9015546.1 fatty acid oxidation complex subunit alpha
MIHAGNAITVQMLSDGIAEFRFDLQGESVNKFNRETLEDFKAAIAAVKADSSVKGLIVTSAKSTFIVGADITEFGDNFAQGEKAIVEWAGPVHDIFNSFEDLEIPKVAAINGIALGGGFEMCLVCDYRVMSEKAQVGLPEVKLGIIPGFGGTVRLSRVIGIDNAIEWIATSASKRPAAALKDGAVDAVVAADKLQDAAIDLVKQAISGRLDWKAKRQEKLDPVKLDTLEQMMAFNSAKGVVLAKANPAQYPAPKLLLDSLQASATESRDAAMKAEAQAFAKAAVTPQAGALIGLFINDQVVKKASKSHEKGAHPVNQAAVLGAGIMGGGIAYQAASKGTPIIMKDIGNPQLALGMSEANGLLTKQVERGRLKPAQMGETLARIRPSLSYEEFKEVDIVIEAVTENPKVKEIVLAETEKHVHENTILASNTSTISITRLAKALQRPENFVGMHFFNPVHMMPLVEVIRGEKTSEEAIATTVVLAQKMGKTPIVVNDCPGFLVNRVLFPYFGAFDLLLKDGADFQQIDKVMEKFGWPMGPAYLMDVVGIDTGVHGAEVMAEGFPDRMKPDYKGSVQSMYEANRLGQKNDVGFYKYVLDKKGKKAKTVDPTAYEVIAAGVTGEKREFDAQEIIDRMMLAFCNETVRCLEDKIVATPSEADMAMIMGVGFPPFRGGPCRYIDQTGVAEYVALCNKYAHLGKAYEAPQMLQDMAANNKKFYG